MRTEGVAQTWRAPTAATAAGGSSTRGWRGSRPQNKPTTGVRQGSLAWAEVAAVTGGGLGQFRDRCPLCSGARSTPAHRAAKVLRVWAEAPGFATFACAHCGARGWVRPDAERSLTRPPAQRLSELARNRDDTERVAFARKVWQAAGPLTDTPSARYLNARGLRPDATDLGHAWAAPYGYRGNRTDPALVAAYRAPDGSVAGVQTTHLDHCARKLRRTTFGRLTPGGAVRLYPLDGDALAVGEGVETSMGFHQLEGLPVWATLGTAGLVSFEPPAGLKRLVIAADNDPSGAGISAARVLAGRARRHMDVEIVMPRLAGTDWADALMERGHAR